MTRAVFTSLDIGAALPATILDLIARARSCAMAGLRVDVQVMCFAFTDRTIAAALCSLCRDCPTLTLRILADWSQSAPGTPSIIPPLLDEGLRNLFVKFKLDAPYRADENGRLRYSYGASWGMLHHKTLLVCVDDQPQLVALGSYNWSARGTEAYENLLISEELTLLHGFAAEFAALWSDHRLTGTQDRARHIMTRLKAEAANGYDLREPKLLDDILGVNEAAAAQAPPPKRQLVTEAPFIAFSGTSPTAQIASSGHAPCHDRRAIALLRPGGANRPAPLTLNTLALHAIRGIPEGASLRVAMYALSPRVPEFGALIDAARRGVEVRLILDGTIGARTAAAIRGFAEREGLPLVVQTSRRRMHQKYLCCPELGMVLTGTANMTDDATSRHSDHRILWPFAPDLAARFTADFDVMSARLAPAKQAA